jgi:hypothetical protein
LWRAVGQAADRVWQVIGDHAASRTTGENDGARGERHRKGTPRRGPS